MLIRCDTDYKDLILFPGDATFAKVEQSAWGRTYVLKFSSSNQRHFVRTTHSWILTTTDVFLVLDAGTQLRMAESEV